MQACSGFSAEVDEHLSAAMMKLATCEDHKKLVVLLLDEMHVRENLYLEYNWHMHLPISYDACIYMVSLGSRPVRVLIMRMRKRQTFEERLGLSKTSFHAHMNLLCMVT